MKNNIRKWTKMKAAALLCIVVFTVIRIFAYAADSGNNNSGNNDPGNNDPGNKEVKSEVESSIESISVENMVSGMSLDEKISQMIIPAIRTWNGTNVTELSAAPGLKDALRKHQYGGIILFGANITGTGQVTRLLSELQENNMEIPDAGSHIPYFLPVDEEGGRVTRLVSGTRMTGSMAVGATGEHAEMNAKLTGQTIGEELKAVGFNVDYAPVVDVNNNPANPVIGTRAFSDDPALVSALGTAYAQGLAENDIIATFKHFPGHGDTATDSHIGTPSVEKTYKEIQQNELIPFQAAIDSGADMIMTAHITFPLIDEKVVYGDGKTKGYYPATMSKKIITDILRTDMGFEGVVVTDALEMDAIRTAGLVPGDAGSAKYMSGIAEKVINAGVDLLLLPKDLNSSEAAGFYDELISRLIKKVKKGTIPEERIDESVTRLLMMKEKYGILDTDAPEKETPEENKPDVDAQMKDASEKDTPDADAMTKDVSVEDTPDGDTLTKDASENDTPDADVSSRGATDADEKEWVTAAPDQNEDGKETGIDAAVKAAEEIVGSDAHHETERKIAGQAVTMLKNDGKALPLSGETSRVVFLSEQKQERTAIQYAVNIMRERGILSEETKVIIDYYDDQPSDTYKGLHYTKELKKDIKKADAVIALTNTAGQGALEAMGDSSVQHRAIEAAIEDVHDAGGVFVLISVNLPYDAARYQDADAILLAYMSSGMNLDPTERLGDSEDRTAYNANVAAAIETVFGGNTPTGTVPVNIPKIKEHSDKTLEYSDEILYERGTGLTY